MMKKNKIFIFLTSIFIIFVAVYLLSWNFNCERLACLSIKNENKYELKKIHEESKYSYRALYQKSDTLLRVEIRSNFSPSDSEQFIKSQIARTRALFEDAPAPYPGQISDVISCGDEYRPIYSAKKQNGIQFSYFTGFVNERLVFGSCTQDQATYRDTLVMFYCDKQKKFYQLEVITPNVDSANYVVQHQEILDSIVCKK